jgi:hypothetical protein
MINISRTKEAPIALSINKMTGVKQVLNDMFYSKCYLCEEKNPTSTEIEHFLSKSKHPHKEYEWGNLFLACQFISDASPKETVKISLVKDTPSEELKSTVLLLDNIFNAKTEGKDFDSKNLTDKVTREVKLLLDKLTDYYNANDGALKEKIKFEIQDLLSIKSPFTAFKFWYIKNRSHLSEFNNLLPVFNNG